VSLVVLVLVTWVALSFAVGFAMHLTHRSPRI
jgi:hypothetical protein